MHRLEITALFAAFLVGMLSTSARGQDAFGSFDWQGQFYAYLPYNPFTQVFNPYVGLASWQIQQQGEGLYGIDGMNQIISGVSGIPYVSAVDTFNTWGNPYGISTETCAACSSALPNLLGLVNGLSLGGFW